MLVRRVRSIVLAYCNRKFGTFAPSTVHKTLGVAAAGASCCVVGVICLYAFSYTTAKSRFKSLHKALMIPITPPTNAVALGAYVPLERLETPLREAMLSQSCGVHVLCLPTGSGKTTAACQIANELLRDGDITGSAYVDLSTGDDVVRPPRGVLDDFRYALRLILWPSLGPPPCSPNVEGRLLSRLYAELDVPSLVHCFPHVPDDKLGGPRTVLILDNADIFFRDNDNSEACVRHLATASIREKSFCVIILCRDPRVAEQIWSYNGLGKIHMIHPAATSTELITHEDAANIIERYTRMRQPVSDDVKRAFVDMAIEVGSPGFVSANADAFCGATPLPDITMARLRNDWHFKQGLYGDVDAFRRDWKQMRLTTTRPK